MTNKHPFIAWCKARQACKPGLIYAKRFKTPGEFWKKGRQASYAAWLILLVEHPEARNIVTCYPSFFRSGLTFDACNNLSLKRISQVFESVAPIFYDGPTLSEIHKAYPVCPWKRGMQ
mgnify:CR=1 FL=1